MKKKIALAVAALVLVLCVAVGGTIAWLISTSAPVKNTFTVGDIEIDLWEHPVQSDGYTLDSTASVVTAVDNYVMIPGRVLEKDPTVTVKKDSEACWLFVKVEESENFDDFMAYQMAEDWTQLKDASNEDVDGVFYQELDATAADTDYKILADDQVLVNDTVTKQALNSLSSNTYPSLTFTAYAIQKESFTTVFDAWTEASK